MNKLDTAYEHLVVVASELVASWNSPKRLTMDDMVEKRTAVIDALDRIKEAKAKDSSIGTLYGRMPTAEELGSEEG